MKFGINILNFGPGTDPHSLASWARFAEEVGYHLVMISDHVAITPDVQEGFPAPFYDPFITLAWLANIVQKAELGTTVAILPYRHPLLTARMAANIDQISGGRFILGTGVGWARQEFKALDVPYEKRGALTDEYLEIVKLCWANDVAAYQGRFTSFDQIHTGPRPIRPAGIPIWVGGSSDGALRRAVRFGDAWHPFRFTLTWLRDEALPKLSRMAETEGKPMPAFCPRFSLQLTERPLPEDGRRPGLGSIDQVHADLKVIASLGAEYILLDTYSGQPGQTEQPEKDWAMLAIMAEQVLDLDRGTIR
jgi:probable F420-dependent oxidoreductase